MQRDGHQNDTIFALSSGHGRAGVAVIRISGPGAGASLKALAGVIPRPREIMLRTLIDPLSGALLDKALVIFFPAPESFTGEDVAELHVHGGPAVIGGVVCALGARSGLRAAEAGEFTRRAFANGKLDLTEVEGLADLIEAETRAQAVQALRQSSGALGALYDAWRHDLIAALAHVEAALDFSDEADVPALVEQKARPIVEALRTAIEQHLHDHRRGERLRAGFTVVLAGPPNVGKSSLLNALAARDVAIVSEEAGTTRDVLEVHLDLDGLPVTVLDTAGIREAQSGVEQEGVRRTLARAGQADLVVWLVDAGAPEWFPPDDLGEAPVITVVNKIDLASVERPAGVDDALEISATQGSGLDALTDMLAALAGESLQAGEAPALTRERHRHELERARVALGDFLEADRAALELRAEDLRTAAQALGRLTGQVDVEDVLDRIFADFCIGK